MFQSSDCEDTTIPEGRTAGETGDHVDSADHQDTLDRSGEGGKEEGAGVVFFPGREVEIGQGRNERRDRPVGASEVERRGA